MNVILFFATENSDPDRKPTLTAWKEASVDTMWMKWPHKQNKNMFIRKKNTYWGKPHHFKNPNCKSKIHKEDDEQKKNK